MSLMLDILRCQLRVRDENLRVVVLMEGWDAAGKGGAIKRLTNPMDPRGIRFIPFPLLLNMRSKTLLVAILDKIAGKR